MDLAERAVCIKNLPRVITASIAEFAELKQCVWLLEYLELLQEVTKQGSVLEEHHSNQSSMLDNEIALADWNKIW